MIVMIREKRTLFLLLTNKGTGGYISKTALNKIVRSTYICSLFLSLSKKDTNSYISEIVLSETVRVSYVYSLFQSSVHILPK